MNLVTPSIRRLFDTNKLFTSLYQRDSTKSLLTSSACTLVIRLVAFSLSFLTSVLLARLLGARAYGANAYAFNLVSFLTLFGTLGLDTLIIRETATNYAEGKWALIHGLQAWSARWTSILAVALMIATGGFASLFRSHASPELWETCCVTLLLLPAMVLTRITSASMQGFRRVSISQIPDQLVTRMVFVALLLASYCLFEDLTGIGGAGLRVMAGYVGLATALFLLKSVTPIAARTSAPLYDVQRWIAGGLPLLLLGVMYLVLTTTDLLMLGILVGPTEVALYDVATKAVNLVVMVPQCINIALIPAMTTLYAQNKTRQLQVLVLFSTRMMFAFTVLAFAFVAYYYSWYIAMLGADFSGSFAIFVVLSLGLIANISMGPVNSLLVLTNSERTSVAVVGTGAALNVTLNAIFIPIWGCVGAATATAISSAAWNMALMFITRNKLNIKTTVIDFNG